MVSHKGLNHPGKPATHKRFVTTQFQLAGYLGFEFVQCLPPLHHQLENVVAIAVEHTPGIVRHDLPGLSQQQWLPHILLQLSNPAAESGLG